MLGIINRTRAGQLAKGALLVMVVYLVANTLNMRTVTWPVSYTHLPNGYFTTCSYPNPEIFDALKRGLELATKTGACLLYTSYSAS